jgi:hypothetical protein
MPRDYVLRLIEQFGLIWRRLVHFKQLQSYEAGLAEVETAYAQLFSLNSKFIDLLPDEGLLSLVQTYGELDPDKCAVLASLLAAEGDFHAGLRHTDEAYRRYERALLLYGALVRAGRSLPRETQQATAHLLHMLEQYELEPPALDDVWRVYAALQQNAKAEDALFSWLEAVEFERESVVQGVIWYETLLRLSDKDLGAGDLPRSEITESHAQLQELLNHGEAEARRN